MHRVHTQQHNANTTTYNNPRQSAGSEHNQGGTKRELQEEGQNQEGDRWICVE